MPTLGSLPGHAQDRVTRPLRWARRVVLRRRRPLAAILAAAAVAAGIHAASAPPLPHVSVLVARHDLAAGVVLTADDVGPARFAEGTAPDGALVGADAVVGHMLASPLRRGEPVTDVRLVGASLTEGRPGQVALPVRLPDAGMVALLHVGDRIDLLAVDPQGAGAELVARDVGVLALPPATDDPGSGFSGRLVVLGTTSDQVAPIAEAAVRAVLGFSYAG